MGNRRFSDDFDFLASVLVPAGSMAGVVTSNGDEETGTASIRPIEAPVVYLHQSDSRKLPLSDLLIRVPAAAVLLILLPFLTWALLTPDPIAAMYGTPLAGVRHFSDIVQHFCAYALLSSAAWLTCPLRSTSAELRSPATCIGILLVVHALGTEYLQSFVPGRMADPTDALCNFTGIAIGFLLTRAVSKVRDHYTTAIA